MTLPLRVHVDPWDVNNRLKELRLDENVLIESAQRGLAAWAACTPNHPPSYPGLASWAEAVRALRDLLAPRGWDRLNESNLPLVIDKSGKTAVTVSTADEATGKPDIAPCTNSAKGPRTKSAIQQNRLQLSLFEEADEETRRALSESINSQQRATWLLLIHRDMRLEELRCELSRPIGMDTEGRVDGWAERIILRATPFNSSESVLPTDISGGPTSPEINIDIKRKA